MAFLNTVDERYGGTFLSSPANARDAPYATNTPYTLAPGIFNAAYGALIRSSFQADIDAYSLGVLQPGRYSIVATGSNWDFSNSVLGLSPSSVSINDSSGSIISTSFTGFLNIDIRQAGNYFVSVFGASFLDSEYQVYYTSNGPIAAANVLATGSMFVAGKLIVGGTVTASGSYSDLNGTSLSAPKYQWSSSTDGIQWSTIPGATNSTYVLTIGDSGKFIGFGMSFSDDAGYDEYLAGGAISRVAAPNTPATGSLTVSGQLVVGSVVATSGTFNDPNGKQFASPVYQWMSSTDGTNWAPIAGATSSTYRLSSADTGKWVSYTVSFYDDVGYFESLGATVSAKVAQQNFAASGSYQVTGPPIRDSTIYATGSFFDQNGTLKASPTYLWASSTDGVNWTPISGATGPQYTVKMSDVGRLITTGVSFTDDAGYAERILASNSVRISDIADTVAPAIISFSPASAATAVPIDANIVLVFSEPIARGKATIFLETDGGSIVERFLAETAANITVSGVTLTLNPSDNLTPGTRYMIIFGSGSAVDLAGNPSPGIDTYSFTTSNRIDGTPQSDSLVGSGNADSIFGGAGNDTISGRAGDDHIDGGAGVDAALYQGQRSSYIVSSIGSTFAVADRIGSDGIDILTAIEKLQFSDFTIDLVRPPLSRPPTYGADAAFLFDGVYYLLANQELSPGTTVGSAFQSFATDGASQHKSPNSWFQADYYANKYPDLAPFKGSDYVLFAHYNLFGVWEGRSGGPRFDHFDGGRYLAENPDVAAYVDANVASFLGSRSNGAIAHFIIFGANEQRVAHDTGGSIIDMGYVL